MILDINKQLDEILKEELLQAEVITTECGKIMRFPNLDMFGRFSIMMEIDGMIIIHLYILCVVWSIM